MALVRDLTAGVLLDADLRDGDLAPAERQAPVHAHNRGALESGRDRTVQVLLARDVHLVHDVAPQHQALLDRHVHRLLVDQKGGRVVHFVGADVRLVQQVDDVLFGLELHQRRAVVFPQFGERRTHVAQHDAVVRFRVKAGRAVTEHLPFGHQLLMHLEPCNEAHFRIIDFLIHHRFLIKRRRRRRC